MLLAIVVMALLIGVGGDTPGAHEQRPALPWMPRPAVALAGVIQHCGPWVRDGYKSIQVNVDAKECNIVGDAANEPSIAVSATDPRKIVIGWRQFDSVLSDFRQAGWGYSHDGGHTWVFRGSLDPGVFGSDPVLAAGPAGEIYYFSINFDESRLFRSYDGGETWTSHSQVFPELLDKPWLAVDRSNGIGRGNIYITSSGLFFRSTNGGESWVSTLLPGAYFATIDVGSEGTVHLARGLGSVRYARSDNARDPNTQPTFDTLGTEPGSQFQYLEIGAQVSDYGAPNASGLIGQAWVAGGDPSRVTPYDIYLLTIGGFDPIQCDPGDIAFVRSADGGKTWSRAVVVNDDPPLCNAWQWFGMMSVAPSGRIDAVWNDTRNYLDAASANLSELYYSYSTDAGATWSPNVPVSPVFDSHVGWPQQAKLGDYYHMVSDNLGVNVAYAATFNGEQDIYFLRIGPWDCNGNEIDDALDISEARSRDCNANGVPDECEYRADSDGDGLTTLTDFAVFVGDLTGPVNPSNRPCSQLSDTDHDGDVDLHDYYLLSQVFTAP